MSRNRIGFWFLALILVSLSACASFKAYPEAADALTAEVKSSGSGIRTFRGSSLDSRGPVPYLVLSGGPYEQGLAYGVLLRGEISRVSVEGRQWLDASMRSIPAFFRPFANLASGAYLRQLVKKTPRRYLDEMKGIAKGAGIPWEVILMSAYGVERQMACTSILSLPGENRGVLHGRNFDFGLSFLGKYPVLIQYKASGSDEVDYWSLGTICYPASFQGGNRAGVSVSINQGGKNKNGNGYPMGWKVREILSKARDLDSVRGIVAETPNDTIDWILSVGSAAEGSGAVFDLMGKMKTEEIAKVGDPEIILNRPFGDGRHADDGLALRYLDSIQHMYGKPRWDAARNFLSKNSLDTPEAVWALLRDRSTPFGYDVFNTRDTTIARASTLFTVAFDLAKGHIAFSSGETYASLRRAWLFDTSTESFSPFLPALDVLATENFQNREKSYLGLVQARLDGSLNLDMLGGIDPETIDPFTLDDFGAPLGYLNSDNPKIGELMRKLYEKYGNTDGYIEAVLATSLRKKDMTQSIRFLEEALACPHVGDFYALYYLSDLVSLYEKTKQRDLAKESAEKWLRLYDRYREGYSSAHPWILGNGKTMRRLAGKP